MDTTMTFTPLPLSTVSPSKYGAQSSDVPSNSIRPWHWLTPEGNVLMQREENDAALWTLLMNLPVQPVTTIIQTPHVHWRVDNRLNMFTKLSAALSASDTYAVVDEPLLINAGYTIYLPQTNQQIYVEEVGTVAASGWTNDASVACNLKISRTTLPGVARAASLGDEVLPGLPVMGESGEPSKGISTVPGDPLFNFVQLSGLYTEMSVMQMNANMNGGWGTHEKLLADNDAYFKQMIQRTLLFSQKGTKDLGSADGGQAYFTDGLISQCQDNVLNAGTQGNALVYENLSEFWDGLFESANSSASKVHACGEKHFMDIMNTANQEGKIAEGITYNPTIGVEEFKVQTGGGKIVTVMKMRYAFEGAASSWGLTMDLGNLVTIAYKGYEDFHWIYGLDIPMRGITTKTDAIVGSIGACITDPDTWGIIRSGTSRVVTRNNLSPVEE